MVKRYGSVIGKSGILLSTGLIYRSSPFIRRITCGRCFSGREAQSDGVAETVGLYREKNRRKFSLKTKNGVWSCIKDAYKFVECK